MLLRFAPPPATDLTGFPEQHSFISRPPCGGASHCPLKAVLTIDQFERKLSYMAKKKGTLTHIYPKDKRAFSLLARSGAMSRETFNKLEITDNRIKSYRQAGLIKEVSVPDRHGNGIKTFYELTDRTGKDFCKRECSVTKFISNGNSCLHNSKVSEYLADNLSKKELESVMSERELQPFIESRLQEYLDNQEHERYQELMDALKGHQLSMPDIIYKTELGTYEAIEVTTDNYGSQELELKSMTCELLSVEVTFVHV